MTSSGNGFQTFDKDRDGFVLGEGAGCGGSLKITNPLRNAVQLIYGEILGYGLTADAHHITTPSSDGPRRCMLNAIKQAGVNPDEIDYFERLTVISTVGGRYQRNKGD